jgi:hypothetical protein
LKKNLITLVILFIFIELSQAQQTIKAIRIDTPPTIDGQVKEPVWDEAFAVEEFYQREPFEGQPVSKKTIFSDLL